MVSPIRIGGLASGMDTETMVKQLMQAERAKVDRYSQQKQLKTWQQERYNAFSKTMASFVLDMKKDLGFVKTTSTGALLPGASEDFSWVKSATTSSTNFTVSATAKATTGNHSIKVTQLAEGVNAASGTAIQNAGENKTISELGISASDFDIKVSGNTVTINSTDTMSVVAKKINDLSGVAANYDSGTRRLFLSTEKTGDQQSIKFESAQTTELNNLLTKLDLKINGVNVASNTSYAGKNSKIDLDGATDLEFQSNTISINGLNIQLKETGATETIQVATDVNSVYDKIKNFVTKYNDLIDTFNGAVKEKQYRDYKPLTDEQKKDMKETDIKLWEEKAKSGLLRNDELFGRITDKLRSGLYEQVREITKSDAQTVPAAGTSLGTAVGSLYELGITTGSYKDKGKLTIDEVKLKEMIAEDPEKVMNTLFKTSDIDEVKTPTTDAQKQQNVNRRLDTGVFVRIFDDMASGLSELVLKAGPGKEESLLRNVKVSIMTDYVVKGSRSDIDKFLDDVNKNIDKETKRLQLKESSYWTKFGRMEKLMSQMQSQSSWIAQQLGSK